MGRDGLTQVWPDSSDLIGANARLHAWVTVAEPSFGASVVAGRDRREPGKQAVVVGGRDARLPRYAVSEQGQAAPVS